jgi:hypothetical protein
MLSIVVCHRNQEFLNQFKQNVSNTIGIAYEIVIIDNITNKYNIFQAYNIGFIQCKYDIICYAHEDIIFHTNDWGEKVIEHFKNSNLGIIGVAGSHYLPKLPSAHWFTDISSIKLIQTNENEKHLRFSRYIENSDLSDQAVIIDGLWMCTTKLIMQKLRFDEETFDGFHCYDSDICLQIKKLHYDVKIVYDITIEHISSGSLDISWLKGIFNLYKKWNKYLPISTLQLSKSKKCNANYMNANIVIDQIQIHKFGFKNILKILMYFLRCTPPINKLNLLLLFRLLKKTLKSRLVMAKLYINKVY